MPEIRHQQPGGSPEISRAEIQIPDDSDLGTGTFTTAFKSKAFSSGKDRSSIMMNAPGFQVSATVNSNGELVVLLGKAQQPEHKMTFVLPKGFDEAAAHTRYS